MKIKMFSVPFAASEGGFLSQGMETFLEEKEVVSVKEQFFVQDGQPWWGIVVMYHEEGQAKRKYGVGYPSVSGTQGKTEKAAEGPPVERKDWKVTLQTEEERTWFELLRRWRSDRAHLEGNPPYTILNDKHLVELLLKKPTTLEELGQVEGFGEARLKRFGKEVLEILSFRKDGKTEEAWAAWARTKQVVESQKSEGAKVAGTAGTTDAAGTTVEAETKGESHG